MLIRVVDFETTGMEKTDRICEVGWQDIEYAGGNLAPLGGSRSRLVDPGVSIPAEASAIHHITDPDVRGVGDVADQFEAMMLGTDIFAAHNAAFEQQFFGGGGKPWICTLKAARRVWADAPGHGNQVLRYWLDLQVDPSYAMPLHRAGPDAYVTAVLLQRLIAVGTSIDDMVRWTKEPSLLPGAIKFGKHRGTPWGDLPSDYLAWIVDKSDLNVDVKFTARHHLATQTAKGGAHA